MLGTHSNRNRTATPAIALALLAVFAAALGICVQPEHPAESMPTEIGASGDLEMFPVDSGKQELISAGNFFNDPPMRVPADSFERDGVISGPSSPVVFDEYLDKLRIKEGSHDNSNTQPPIISQAGDCIRIPGYRRCRDCCQQSAIRQTNNRSFERADGIDTHKL